MKNILFLLDFYLPKASPNGVCCEKVAKELAARGYRVFVGCYREQTMPDREEIDGIQVRKVLTYEKTGHKKPLEKIGDYGKWLNPFLAYPPAAIPQRVAAIEAAAERIVAAEMIDTVICVHLPIETLIAGQRLRKKHPEIRFYAYMLDSMSGGFCPRFLPEPFARGRKLSWERRLLDDFDRVILMESSRAHHAQYAKQQKWLSKAVFSDIPLMVPTVLPEGGSRQSLDKIRIVFTGTMADGVRTPYFFLNLLGKVKGYSMELVFAGHNFCKKDIAEMAADIHQVRLKHMGTLPHGEALELISSADVLLNLGNTNSALVPSKIFEYMSFGKPIISTYCTERDASLAYLNQYPLLLALDERCTDLEEQARKLERYFAQMAHRQISYLEVSRIFKQNTPGAFVDVLESWDQGITC